MRRAAPTSRWPAPARSQRTRSRPRCRHRLRGQALAPATLRAYRADWQHFCAWCRAAGWSALPAAPATVAPISPRWPNHTSSALVRRLAALSRAHRLAASHGRPPIRRSATPCAASSANLSAGTPGGGAGNRRGARLGRNLRDHTGRPARPCAAAAWLCRCAAPLELVAIEYEHITFDKDGLRLLIPHAKGDQANAGANIGIPRAAHPIPARCGRSRSG